MTIVILNWNGLDDTLECLGSLAGLCYQNFELVVVDNGSDPREAEKIKVAFPAVAVVGLLSPVIYHFT